MPVPADRSNAGHRQEISLAAAPLLVAYIKTADQYQMLSTAVEGFDLARLSDMSGLRHMDRLLAMQGRQARLLESL